MVEYWALLIFADFPSRYGIDLYRVVLVSDLSRAFLRNDSTAYYFLGDRFDVNKRKQYVKLKASPGSEACLPFPSIRAVFPEMGKGKNGRCIL